MAAKLEPIGVEAIAKGVGSFLNSMKQMEDAFDRTSKKLDGFAPATAKATSGTQKLGGVFSKLLPSLSGAAGGLGGAVSSIAAIAGPAALAVGGLFALKKGFDLVTSAVKATTSAIAGFIAEGMQMAGRFQEMEISALAVGRAMGLQEKEIRGAIDSVNDAGIRYDIAGKTVASLAKNQIDLSKATELVNVAQGAAILLGEDSSATMERLTWAVTTQNTRMMRYMGIMVDFTAAQERFAAANDRDAESLTQVEKNMIAVNEAVRAGASVAGIYGEAMKSPTKALRSLTGRELPELKAAVGAPFLQAWATAINAVRGFVNALTDAMREGGALYPILVNLGAIASILADAFSAALQVATNFITSLSDDFGQGFGDLIVEMARWGAEMVAALAEGIITAASTVLVTAMDAIGGVLGFFLAPGSAPRVAPGLVKWGIAAMGEYLHGMTMADFSILEKIQAPLKQVLSGKEFADISADMIKAFSEGTFGEGMFARIAEVAGAFGTEIAELARLQWQLAEATRAVEEAEKRVTEGRKKVADLTSEYNDLVRTGASKEVLRAKLAEINAAEEGLELAKGQQAEAKEQVGTLEEQAKLQDKVVKQLISMGKAAAPPAVGAAAAAAAGRMPRAPKPEDFVPEDFMPDPAQFDISSRMSEAIDKAKALIKEKLAYIFQPFTDAWQRMKEGPIADFLLSMSKLGLQVLEAISPFTDFVRLALALVWMFITDKLIPKLTELGRDTLAFLKRVIGIQIRAWLKLLGGIQDLWTWVNEVFIPWIEEKFVKALELIKEVIDKIKEGFDKVIKAAEKLIEWLEKLIEKLREAAAAANPFTGGSPSPLELGLRGAARAMQQLATVEVPRLSASMQMAPSPAYAGGGFAPAGGMTNNVTVPIGPVYIQNDMDMAAFEIRVENAVKRQINRSW
jgi:hypothetical protein